MLRYKTKLDLVLSPCTTSGQETERVYSYNSRACRACVQVTTHQQIILGIDYASRCFRNWKVKTINDTRSTSIIITFGLQRYG